MIGVGVGAISGWLGGWVDATLMRFVDAMLSFPALFLLLIIFSMVGATVGTIILFLGLFKTSLKVRVGDLHQWLHSLSCCYGSHPFTFYLLHYDW